MRLNESGDFRNQKDVNKAIKVANGLHDEWSTAFTTYCYTARYDLNSSKRGKLIINGSGIAKFKEGEINNKYVILPKNTNMNKQLKLMKKGDYLCPHNCHQCKVCMEDRGLTVYTFLK